MIPCMAKNEPTKPRKGDRHKPNHRVRLKLKKAQALQILAERNDTSIPEEADRAIREYLERNGLWGAKDS